MSFVFGTFLLSPDLDLRNSIPTKNWGILKIIWLGYHKMFKHRGKSHSLVFSSISKILYLFLVSAVLGTFTYFGMSMLSGCDFQEALVLSEKEFLSVGELVFEKIVIYKNYLLSILLGIAISDWIHIVTDRICTAIKRRT